MKVAILVTHLLGTGHLARASLLADALEDAGHEACVLSGGMPAPLAMPTRAELVQISPVRADGPEFRSLLSTDGCADENYLERRCAEIEREIRRFRPHILVTELFPFGRRKLAREYVSAIRAARSVREGMLVYASIRDVLQLPRKAGRKEEAEARFADDYDGALFHGDPNLLPMSTSWPLPTILRDRIAPTGYIGPAPEEISPSRDGAGEFIVAAGGGSVGDRLFETAISVATTDSTTWRLLVGGSDRSARIAAFRAMSQRPNVIVEAVRPDFSTLLRNCAAAVLQCGYNTAMDVLATGARTVFVPFEGPGGETEQLMRARAFAARFAAGLVREEDLDAQSLREGVAGSLAGEVPDYSNIAMDGATRSVALLERAFQDRHGDAG